MLISADVGYCYTKVEPGGIIFLSTVGKGRKLNLTSSKSDLNSIQVQINGTKYFVGELARRESYDASLAFQDNKAEHENTIVLILTGIILSINDNIQYNNLNLITELPVVHINQKEQLIKMFQNKVFDIKWKGLMRTIKINHVLVFPQAAGALFSTILDENGNIKKEQYLIKKIGIADVGFKTTDFITLNKGEYIDKESGTINLGMNHALKMISTNLLLHEVEENDNFTEELEKAKNDIGRSIADNLYLKLPNLDDYFAFYLAGGGGKYLKQKIPKAILIENAQRANALGFLKVGRKKLNASDYKSPGE